MLLASFMLGCADPTSRDAPSVASASGDTSTARPSGTLAPAPVDVLFVVDRSSVAVQDALAAGIPTFLDPFLGSGLDYRIAVTRTEGPVPEGYLAADTPSPVEWFVQLASTGAGSGSGVDAGLDAAQRAIDGGSFYRSGAVLHTIVVTAAADESALAPADFAAWYDALKADPDDATFSCLCDPATGGAYLEVAAEVGGLQLAIADDWSASLAALAATTVDLAER